jgi:hypothetical protein
MGGVAQLTHDWVARWRRRGRQQQGGGGCNGFGGLHEARHVGGNHGLHATQGLGWVGAAKSRKAT